ncbi:MAG: PilZ domain-containing protein [Candidatus Omnitrophica bacterium]|nr:PilZ domain-containing protein [Candidatus Omnitrophota bacterium]
MVKQATDERRRAVRAQRILSIQYRVVQTKTRKADKHWHLSTTHDMSATGLSFLSDIVYRIDDVLEMHVVMSGVLDVFKGYGQVVRIDKKDTGSFCFIAVKFVKSPRTTARRAKNTSTAVARRFKK